MIKLFKPNKTYEAELVIEFVNGFIRSRKLTTTAKNIKEATDQLNNNVYNLLERRYIVLDHKTYALNQLLSWNLQNVKET